jgi:DNA mismatch repair protein MutS
VDEGGHAALARAGRRQPQSQPAQLGLFGGGDPRLEKLRQALATLDVDSLRPIDALNLLAEWKKGI